MGIMDIRYVFVYAATDIFCIAMIAVILSKLSYGVGSDLELRLFKYMSLCFLAFATLELIWVLSAGGILFFSERAQGLIKIFATLFVPLMVYFWFRFAETRFRTGWIHKPLVKVLTFIPAGILILLYITSFKTGLVFTDAPDGSIGEGPLYAISGVVDNIYGIAIIVHALILFFKEKSRYRRKGYLVHIAFIVICTLGGIADMAVTMTPIMPLAIAFSFIFLFMNLQEGQIFHDALTGINNRRSADRYLDEVAAVARPDNPYSVYMMDINRFKEINDNYGHLEGDRALILLAGILREAAEACHGFTARWGGDEFLVILRENDPAFTETIPEDINRKLYRLSEENQLPYTLRMSAGRARCHSPKQSVAELIREADERLYEDKKRTNAGR